MYENFHTLKSKINLLIYSQSRIHFFMPVIDLFLYIFRAGLLILTLPQ